MENETEKDICTSCEEPKEIHYKTCIDCELKEVSNTNFKMHKLEKDNRKLIGMLEGLERVKDIWLPDVVDEEHAGEAEALHNFRNEYLELLPKKKGK